MNRHTLMSMSVAVLALATAESREDSVDDTTPPDYLKGPPIPPPDEVPMLSMFPMLEFEPRFYLFEKTKRRPHEPDMAKRTSFPDTLRGAKGHRNGAKGGSKKR